MIALDSFTIVMGIIFFLAMFGPLVYLLWAQKRRIRKMMKSLKEMGLRYNLQFENHEIWNDKALGLDSSRKILLFINNQQGVDQREIIDLAKAMECRVFHSTDRVELQIDIKDQKGASEKKIVLFDTSIDDSIDAGMHFLLAKKWAGHIKSVLSKKTLKPRKAA